MIRSLFFCLSFALSASSFFAQDIHFTQFYASPLLLNPALTGAFDGQLRASMIYRDQWSGVVETPFITTTANLDFRFPLKINGRKNGDAASAGIVFMNDRVTEFDFTHNQIIASGAYHKMIDKRRNQILSGGFQAGIGQRSINYSNLSFQDMFSINPDGTSGFFMDTNEDLPTNNISFFDASVGINYSIAPKNGVGFYLGGAVYHLNQPDISYYSRDDDSIESESLERKYNVHVAGAIPLGNLMSLQPRALLQLQGSSFQTVVGSNIRFQVNDYSSTALHLGSWIRGVREIDAVNAEAVVALVGLEYHNFLLGMTYDVGLNNFTTGNRGRGAFELSIAYLGNYNNNDLLCPQF